MKRMSHCPVCMHSRIFTLIELLITIAIIAILAGLLLPALGAARDKALAIRCMGNLKQLAVIGQQYANDYSDFLMSGDTEQYADTQRRFWYTKMAEYLPPMANTATHDHSLIKSMLFVCPKKGGTLNDSYQKISYGYNINLGDWKYTAEGTVTCSSQRTPLKITKIKRPSTVILTCDSNKDNLPYLVGGYSSVSSDKLRPRHSDGSNAAIVDGHASFLRSIEYNYIHDSRSSEIGKKQCRRWGFRDGAVGNYMTND